MDRRRRRAPARSALPALCGNPRVASPVQCARAAKLCQARRANEFGDARRRARSIRPSGATPATTTLAELGRNQRHRLRLGRRCHLDERKRRFARRRSSRRPTARPARSSSLGVASRNTWLHAHAVRFGDRGYVGGLIRWLRPRSGPSPLATRYAAFFSGLRFQRVQNMKRSMSRHMLRLMMITPEAILETPDHRRLTPSALHVIRWTLTMARARKQKYGLARRPECDRPGG